MSDTLIKTKTDVVEKPRPRPKPPSEVRILLSVCSCYSREKLTLVSTRAVEIANLLRITVPDLEIIAITAMFTGRPQVVGCYKQRDVAQEVLAQLRAQTPFISRPCHSFSLGEE